jgi:tetratricopeptide (TPR) repeat protein
MFSHEPPEDLPTLQVTWLNQLPSYLLVQVADWLERIDPEQSFAYYDTAIAVDSECSDAAWQSGRLAFKLHRYEYAVEKLEYALAHAPDHGPTHLFLSMAHLALGDTENALHCANVCLRFSPLNSGAHLQKLRCLAELKRWQELATACQLVAPDLHPSHEQIFWRSVAAAGMGHVETARTLYSSVAFRIRREYPEFARHVETCIDQQT